MFVVSDTSVISNMASIGLLDVLKNQCVSVTIPTAVDRELSALDRPVPKEAIERAKADGWLCIARLNSEEAAFAASLALDPGEAEAIALARARNATLLCMDERRGRATAIALGLPLTGILGLLLREKADGRLAALKPHLIALVEESNFFISLSLMEEVLKLARE